MGVCVRREIRPSVEFAQARKLAVQFLGLRKTNYFPGWISAAFPLS
jgi:hypothetical protein